MKENIKIHVIELFKRHQINNPSLEKEMISALEEKYESILKETDNEIISFNKTISLIGDIELIKSENRVILKEQKKDLLYKDKKKIRKFSKYSFIFITIIYLIFSFIFKSWLTSWLILFLSILITQLYKIYLNRSNATKTFNIINYVVNILSIFIIILTVSIGAFMSNYDYKFELNDIYIQKQYKFSENLDKLEINLIKSELYLKTHDENNIIVNQYAKNSLKEKYKFATSFNDDKLLISENDTSFIFSKYYYSIYEVLVPKNFDINEINLYGISSNFYLELDGDMNKISVESTSGNISINGKESGVKQTVLLKTLRGNIEVKDLFARKLDLSSTSGYINIDNGIIEEAKVSSLGGQINIKKLMSNSLEVTSNSGGIILDACLAKFDLNSKKGAIKVNNIMPTDDSKIKTENSDIYFTFDINRLFNLDVKTENGILTNEYYDDLDGINININSINGNIYILMNEKA